MKKIFIGLFMFASSTTVFANNGEVKQKIKKIQAPADTCTITVTVVVNGFTCTGTGTATDCKEAEKKAIANISCN